MPALATTVSSRPHFSTAAATRASLYWGSRTSPGEGDGVLVAKLTHQRSQAVVAAGAQRHLGAGPDQRSGCRRTDSGARSGDRCNGALNRAGWAVRQGSTPRVAWTPGSMDTQYEARAQAPRPTHCDSGSG